MAGERILVMPKLGLTMTEGTVASWKVAPGEAFEAGAILVVVESEKVAFDVEAPLSGTLDEILVGESETVPVGTPIAVWHSATEQGSQPVSDASSAASSASAAPTEGTRQSAAVADRAPSPQPATALRTRPPLR